MTFIEPMLAETHPKGATLDRYGDDWYAEEKLDGERRGIRISTAGAASWSRLENAHALPKHLTKALERLPVSYLDAEITVPGGKSWDVKASKNSKKLVLVLFDILEVLGQSVCNLPQSKRNEYLDVATAPLLVNPVLTEDPDHPVPAVVVAARYSREDAPFQTFYDTVVENGGEGLMLKRLDAKYRPGIRSDAWLKVKQVIEIGLPVVDFSEGTTPNLLSIAHLTLPNGTRTTVKARTMQDAQQWTERPSAFIGRTMEIAAQCWTPDGSLRHPRMVRWQGPHE